MYKLCVSFYKDFMEFTRVDFFGLNVNLKFPEILGSTMGTAELNHLFQVVID